MFRFRWVDSNAATFASTVHDNEATVNANKKKPRITSTNRSNVQKVWGGQLRIPEFIDGYNHQMNAVDRADQLIASLCMKHKCRRTWMPFLLYLLNTMRVNSYIVHRELGGKLSHMDFALGLVRALLSRRNDAPVTRKRNLEGDAASQFERQCGKRMRASVDPLPDERLRNPEGHKASFYQWRRKCFYCRYKAAVARNSGKTAGKVNICSRGCPACGGLALCKACFDVYHSTESQ